jgi:hypothetical protein
MPSIAQKVGTEFRINTNTGFSQSNPAMASFANGGSIVVWTDQSATLGDDSITSIKAQRYDAGGNPLGGEFLVNTTTPGFQGTSSVAVLAGGGFVVAWEDAPGGNDEDSDFNVRAAVFDANGSRIGSDFLVNTFTSSSQTNPSVTALAGGGFVVVWEDLGGAPGDASGTGVRAQLFNASGAKAGSEFLVNSSTEGAQWRASVAAQGSGFVVAWEDASGTLGDSGSAIHVQRFDANGARLGDEQRVNTTTAGAQSAPAIAVLSHGGFVVAWEDDSRSGGDASESAIKAQFFDASGVKTGAEVRVNTTVQGDQFAPQLAARPHGGVVATWTDLSGSGGDTSGAAVRGQALDAAGNRIGDEFLANTVTANDQRAGNVTALDGDSFLFAWQTLINDTIDIRGQQFTVPATTVLGEVLDLTGKTGDSVAGGKGADTYRVDDAGDTAVELPDEGVDTVQSSLTWTLAANLEKLVLTGTAAINGTGNAANNNMTGNAAANQLSGGAGNDTLTGGAGNDTLVGGGGNDVYVVGNGDVLTETASGGTDLVKSNISWTLTDGLEKLTLTGTAAINGTGNAAANTLTGNAAANALGGGDGNDTLLGKGGADVLSGGNGSDKLSGGKGADAFVFDAALTAANIDTVTDFVSGSDKLRLDDDVFTALGTGALPGTAFRAGAGLSAAQDADDRIVYNTTTGALYYDADGAGGAGALQFAVIGTSTHPVLKALDFVVIG